MSTTALSTERLCLRRPRRSDLAAIHAIMARPEAMRYWATPEHASLEETRDWLERTVAASEAGASDEFMIELDGSVIGKAGAWKLPEIGYILCPDHWRQGYASEVMRAVIDHLFDSHPVDALTADVDPRNLASLQLLARLGFVETGREANTIKWRDEWCDSIYLALKRSDWVSR